MALTLELTDPLLHPKLTAHRIAPVRFARAVDGFADDAAPDLDDHGFILPDRFCTAKGPVVGLMGPETGKASGPTVRIQVIRDRIEKAAQLFATIDDASVAQIEFPVGAALNTATIPAAGASPERPPDCIFLRGVKTGDADSETKVKLHFGSAGGPVMAEIAVRVYPRLVIHVQPHLVSINGTGPTTDLAAITSIFKDVSKIYAQAGVVFEVDGTALNETVTGFARAGTVTLSNVADQRNQELQTVLNQNPDPASLNAYVFGHYFDTTNGQADQVLGIAFSVDDANANPPAGTFPGCQPGITLRDSTDPLEAAHTAAHEIGHSLRLIHYAGVNAGSNNQGKPDIWAHRCLMHPVVGITTVAPSSAVRADVGYGTLNNGFALTGSLLMTKPRAGIRQSDEINVLRDSVKAGTFKAIQR